MTIEKIASQLDDIFNIPRDGSNIQSESQESGYANAAQGNTATPFEQKAAEVNAKLSSIASPIAEEVEYVAEVPKAAEPKAEIKKESISQAPPAKEVPNEPKPTTLEGIIEGALSAKNAQPRATEQVADKQASDSQDVGPKSNDEDKPEVRTKLDSAPRPATVHTEVHSENAIGVENEDDWLLESPTPRYAAFYEEKRKMLPKLLRGGKLPIEQYGKEMRQASIDTKVDLYDFLRISDKMTEIRKWQTRIMDIRGEVLSQYHSWKRAVELFQGLLARAEYSKPAIAQEGTNYNHMRDMEMYFADLQYLYDFSKEMLANLESHFESLSRQVTLAMPQKGVERYEQTAMQQAHNIASTSPPANIKIPEKRHDLSGYDRLENGVKDKGFSPEKTNSNSTATIPKKSSGWGIVG